MSPPADTRRRAGLLLPLFSLRTSHDWGVGEISGLPEFARWAREAGFSALQLLPIMEVVGGESSPYSTASAFGIDPVYLGLDACEDFVEAGGLRALAPELRDLVDRLRGGPRVDWHAVRAVKQRALDLAFARFVDLEWRKRTARARLLEAFAGRQAAWLEELASFQALHDREGRQAWTDWPAPLRDREPAALAGARERLAEPMLYRRWTEWQLDEQWRRARSEAAAVGVALGGDLPFVVAGDSADVWSRRHEFRLDLRLGVPPDQFTDEGQDWGLPVYRWSEMERSGFAWMRARAARMADLFDFTRVDHVVGLYRTYARKPGERLGTFDPPAEPAQTRLGEAVLGILRDAGPIVAEDLGVVPDFVRASLARLGLPGMRVLRWEKDDAVFRDPATWPSVSVATTGTHDTEPLAVWYEALPPAERAALLALPGLAALRARGAARFDDGVRDALLHLVCAAPSDLAVLPFQDAFGLPDRINLPGTISGDNWTWRMAVDVAGLAADRRSTERLRHLAARTGRGPW